MCVGVGQHYKIYKITQNKKITAYVLSLHLFIIVLYYNIIKVLIKTVNSG